jgi:hypothetical protein
VIRQWRSNLSSIEGEISSIAALTPGMSRALQLVGSMPLLGLALTGAPPKELRSTNDEHVRPLQESVHCRLLVGSTPANVKKSIMRKLSGVPPCAGSVGSQFGWTFR